MSISSRPARFSSARMSSFRLACLFGLAMFAGSAAAQHASVNGSCAATGARGALAMRAPASKAAVSLCDGYSLEDSADGGSMGTPLALASADFDEDGMPDLVSGFSSGTGGSLVIHRGNVAALWPYGAAAQSGTPAPFLPHPHRVFLPEAPDFVAAGDFDGDGHADIVTASRGGRALFLMKGDGKGGFAPARRIELAGEVTDLIAGEVNQADGVPDLVVAVSAASGSVVLVYQSSSGALQAKPESFAVSRPVTALTLGKFAGSSMRDLAIGAGSELTLITGRDRSLASGSSSVSATVTKQTLGFSIRALASGDFTGGAPSVAALGDDGSVHVLEHAVHSTAMAVALGNSGAAAGMQVVGGEKSGSSAAAGSALGNSTQARIAALREMASQTADAAEWTEHSTIALPGGFNGGAHGLVAARVSGSLQEDLLVVDSGNSQVHVLSTRGSRLQLTANAMKSGSIPVGAARMSVLASMSAASAPTAVLPMRLNQHGLSGLVALQSGVSSPVIMPHDVAPTGVFTVTNTLDITSASQKNSPPAGSLRAAMEAAQSASSTNGGGTYSIVFNIPTSDPGYNAATGVYKIQPLSENVPNSSDNFALPPINATLTIDGYTQPGASPNTSTTADNAKIVIQIDGAKATTTGGSGFVPFDDVGTVIRGIAFTGWTNPAVSGGTASGAEGIEANGVGDFIEGNFFGTVDGITAAPNRLGIFADNGPLFGSAPGNTIGGTTPQARNILSGNTNSGILFLATAYEAQLQGNFIGLDATGRAKLANAFDGAGLNGPNVTIGGTAPGAGNVIAGNGTNVDINDLTNGGAAKNSLVAGNLIGVDPTGTRSIGAQGAGVSILHSVSSMTIGGATPAARNVISGNSIGVYVFDSALNNVIQGNYIGTDITGAVAVPNSQQGFISGRTTSTTVPAVSTTISGNVISGNTLDGIQISGTVSGSSGYLGNTIQGNMIGTDATGTKSLPNQGNGISILSGGTNNVIGGTATGLGNVIANNALNGVLIDPGTGNGPGTGNVTLANIIASNSGAGVRVKSGTGNRISTNSIYSNAALGIDIDAAGPATINHCNVPNSGANALQNFPTLTPGTGTKWITATATDPNGNTSEFSQAVQATQTGNLLSLLGSFDGTANTTFTLEFFSNTSADASGYGQGQTYLGNTTVKTNADCTAGITDPIDLTQADVSVNLTQSSNYVSTGPDFGVYTYTATVTNNGPATAHSVTLTDALPAQMQLSSTYCNLGPCQSPLKTTQGTCSVSGKTITCNLGTLAPGGVATVVIPVQFLAAGSVSNTVNVSATEVDPNTVNNTSSQTATSSNAYAFIDHVSPATVLANSPDLKLDIYGIGFTPDLKASFNGTPVTVLGFIDNQSCGSSFSSFFCSDLQVLIPAAQLTTAGAYTVSTTDANNNTSTAQLTVAAACTYSVFSSLSSNYSNSGTNLIAGSVSVSTNVSSCPWTATSSVPWATILDNPSATGGGRVDIAIAPNTTTSARSGSVTVAGTVVNFTQDAGSASVCSVALDPTSATAPSAGGAGSFNATLSNSSCAPFAEAYPQTSPWITITNSSNLLIESGPVNYTVAPNNGPARTGSIVVGGNAALITQAAPSCYFTLSSASTLASAAGATGSITVTPTPSSCSWTATPSNSSQVSITSGATGTGTGTVNYTVAPNTGGPVTPTITIGNSAATSVFTINQASAFTCTFTVSPTPVSVTSYGTSNVFTVTASYSMCKWTAASNNSDSLTITGATSGMGTGAVFYSVAKNTGAARTLTITAGCQQFTVNQDGSAVTNPAPTLTSLQPSSVTAGAGAVTLTVNGTGFVTGSVVNVNGAPRTTTYVSSTQLNAALLAGDVANPGSDAITVTNPAPGGGTSNTLNLAINTVSNNPVPTLTSLQPSSTTAGSAAFTLTATGTNFISTSVINFGGTALATTYVSATQLTATVPASAVATAGTPSVTVTNPTPGGGTSNALTFTVNAANNPVPALTSLQPSSIAAGSSAFTLTVTGTNFIASSVINFGGTALTTTYVSATQLTATVPASAVATAGTPSVTVSNPAPGGGTSNALTFTVNAANNPVPALTALQPSSTTAGSAAFTLTVTGTNFVSTSVVNFGGSALATTYVSATQLTAAVPAPAVATAGTPSVTVSNPTPGGGTSNALTFTVSVANNPVPALTALQPSSTAAGSAAFTLTVTGTNFVSGAAINFGGSALTTTYVSATQLTATVPASAVAATGTPSVTVTNPAPGGGASNALTFTITAANNPAPTLTALQPTSVAAGSAAFTLTVTGTNFLATSKVNFNGAALTTTYVSATQLTASVPAANVASAGTPAITITNPTPGGGTSNSLTLNVTATPSFTMSNSGAQTVAPGATVQYTITATAMNGTYANPVALTISGLPSGATATFNPTSITPNATSAQSTLTITLPQTAAALRQSPHTWSLAFFGFPFLGLLLFRRPQRRRFIAIGTLALGLFLSVGMTTGCGNNGFNYSTVSPQTYSLTVTGTSGAVTSTTTLQLTVNYVTK